MATISRGIERMVAVDPDVQRALQAIAEDVAARAGALAAGHSDSGSFATSFSVTRGAVNRYVESDDPAGLSKEYGRTGASGKGVSKGVYALTRALNGEG